MKKDIIGFIIVILNVLGTKTYTIFAPTDAAFAASAVQTGQPVWSETDGPEVAKTIALKHIMPTTLYSAGMRYYHQKDTLRPQFTLRIQKNGGNYFPIILFQLSLNLNFNIINIIILFLSFNVAQISNKFK